jgi:2-polyprenyl-6-methoxyphenol hydroxylase-like FAD-dependent oxidoreductase
MGNDPLHVIIIGAGTGGMCLAHGLKRAGIRVDVYERDRERAHPLQGFRVGIGPDGSRALHDCLSPELFEIFRATCAIPMRRVNFFTEKLKEVLWMPGPEQVDPVNSEKSVSRMTLRQVLLTDMDDVVHFDKKFTHYTDNADGTVTAHFEDGTSATGDVLVGADGTRSKVREQYLPHAKIKDAGVLSIGAKVPLTDRVREILPPEMLEGSSFFFAPKGMFAIIHLMEFNWDRDAKLKNNIGGNQAELIAKWPGLMFDNTRDHLTWGLAIATDKAPAKMAQARGRELVEVAKEITPTWSPVLHKLFDETPADAIFLINIATSEPIPQWETTNVTLIGDAIHTMTPGQGVGANTALRDARLLCKKLVEHRDGKIKLLDGIQEYETRMIDYGFKAVKESLKQFGSDNPMEKPVLGRLMLGFMRTTMRLTNVIPPMKKKMASSMSTGRGANRVED